MYPYWNDIVTPATRKQYNTIEYDAEHSAPSPSSPSANNAFVPTPHKEISTNSSTKESESVSKISRVCNRIISFFTGNQKKQAPQCTKEASCIRNPKQVNSNSSLMPYTNVVRDNSQFPGDTFIGFHDDENDKIKTLEDALRHFGLYTYLEVLDSSIEELRRCRITDSVHEECFKQIDKEILKLALKYHPDTVMHRKGTENEMKTAHNLQTALNAVRTVLSYLNAAFLADIRTDHKFQFYSKLNITSLCNQKEVKSRIYEMKFRLSMVSRIKHQNIILKIREFLIESKKCVSNYIQGEEDEFKKLCGSVFFHLNECIEGFEKLYVELKEVEKQCKVQKDEHMLPFVQNMARDIKRDLKLLDLLEKSAKSSMKGTFEFFCTEEFVDPFFVRPLVWYTNVIIMCQIMTKNASFRNKVWANICPKFNEFSELKRLYYLTAYYCGNKSYECEVKMILNNEHCFYDFFGMELYKNEIISKFHEILDYINTYVANKFNVDHYTEVMTEDILALELEKCMLMMIEFNKKKQDLSESIKEFHIKTEKMEEKYDYIVQTSKDLDSKIEEMVQANSQIEAMLEENDSAIQELLEASKKLRENSQ